jgi:hypothetical protein
MLTVISLDSTNPSASPETASGSSSRMRRTRPTARATQLGLECDFVRMEVDASAYGVNDQVEWLVYLFLHERIEFVLHGGGDLELERLDAAVVWLGVLSLLLLGQRPWQWCPPLARSTTTIMTTGWVMAYVVQGALGLTVEGASCLHFSQTSTQILRCFNVVSERFPFTICYPRTSSQIQIFCSSRFSYLLPPFLSINANFSICHLLPLCGGSTG